MGKRKYGAANIVNLNPLKYNICLIGESGIGKTTIAKEVCEELAGPDGYIALDMGKEDGHSAINGIITAKIETWEDFEDFTEDVIENKETDYKDLQIIILDTYDQTLTLAENEVVRLHNKTKGGSRITSIKAAFGGYQAGEEKALELVLDKLWELKAVGVHFFAIGHTKRRDIEDAITGETYSNLTTNMPQRYFTGLKTKLHFLGVASIDRTIKQEKTGKNLFTGEEEIRGKIIDEKRIITFRDDNYAIDSKSRFAKIIPQIPFTAKDFIAAMTDAIETEYKKTSPVTEKAKKAQAKETKKEEVAKLNQIKKTTYDKEVREAALGIISDKYGDLEDTLKDKLKEALAKTGSTKFSSPDISLDDLKDMVSIIEGTEEKEEDPAIRKELLDNLSKKFDALSEETKETLMEALAKAACSKFNDPNLPLETLSKMVEMTK